MVKDAEATPRDKRRREANRARNRLDTLVYEVEKSSKDGSTSWTPRSRPGSTRPSRGRSRPSLGRRTRSPRRWKSCSRPTPPRARRLYRAQRGAGALAAPSTGRSEAGGGRGGEKDNVVDADYEIVDDDKKKN